MKRATKEQVLKARTRSKKTQTQAGEIIETSQTQWAKWESGDRNMPFYKLEIFLTRTGQTELLKELKNGR